MKLSSILRLITGCLFILLANSAIARYSSPQQRGPVRDPGGQRQIIKQDGNNVALTISNWGEYGNPDLHEGYYGMEYPKGSQSEFLFSAGIWVGAIVDGRKFVSTGCDGDNGTNEFSPSADGFICQSNVHPDDPYRFSLIAFDDDDDWNSENDDLDGNGAPSMDWDGPDNDINGDGIFFYDPEPHIDEDPPGDISSDMLDNDNDGLVDADDQDFDGDQITGSRDDDGDDLFDEDGAAMADGQITAIYDDIDRRQVNSPDNDGHTPLNIRIEETSYSWNFASPISDAVIFETKIRNVGEDTLWGLRFALFADPDIAAQGEGGDQGSLDDWNYFDADHLMAVQGDDSTDEGEWAPGVFAIKILKTPKPLDELNIGFKNFSRTRGGDPETNADKYDLISADDEENSPPTGERDDWRYIISFGPTGNEMWALFPGESMDITYALIAAEDTEGIVTTADAVQEFYDVGREQVFRGEYIPIPAKPNVADVGSGEALSVTWQQYGRMPQIESINLYYGDSGDLHEIVNVGEDVERIIGDLVEGTSYYFAISLNDIDGNESLLSDTTWAIPLSIPRKPVELKLEEELYHAISLSWIPNRPRELDLLGYNIYRSLNGGDFTPVNQDPVNELHYLDQINEFGIYTYRLTAEDADGNESPAYGADSLDNIVRGAPFIMDDPRILLVDETRDGNGRPGSPDDAQADSFYHAILGAREYDDLDYFQFRANVNRTLTAVEIGKYRTIVWHSDDKADLRLKDNRTYLQKFIEFGGNVVISGWDVLTNFATVDSDSQQFPAQSLPGMLGIVSGKRVTERDFQGALGRDGYDSLSLDRDKVPVNWYGLDKCWIFELSHGERMLDFNSLSDDPLFEGMACGVKTELDSGAAIILGFPLYFMDEAGARAFLESALSGLETGVPTDESSSSVPDMLYLAPPFPNPFNSTTTITFSLSPSAGRGGIQGGVRLAIYDLTGRLVTNLLGSTGVSAGTHKVIWDAGDLSAGVYLVRLEANGQTRIQKLILLR